MKKGHTIEIMDRIFSGEADSDAMAELVREFPGENLHVVDLPYRFSSWSFDYPENIRLWTDEQGRVLAWAVLQVPFWTIDYAYHPEFHQALYPQILKWTDEQARKIVNTPSGHPAWYVPVPAGSTDRIHDLEEAGFASQENVGEDSWSQVLMEHSMQIPDHTSLPDGFQIRPLNGMDEAEAYVELHRAVFESKNMTTEWRNRTLQRREYLSDLDLVVEAPNGQLAGFCVCWLAKDTEGVIHGQVEPLGIRPEYRKLGLGQAVLSEGLKRLHAKSTSRIYVQTESHRDSVFRLYESAGFRVTQKILMYRKNY